jgi:hypothetical protein
VRWLLITIAIALLGASPASAKPKAAVTVGGDADDKLGEALREALDGKLAVLAPKEVERAMSKLRLSGELEEGDVERLRDKLDAAVLVQGKVGRAGAKKTVKLTVFVRGRRPSDFNVQYKSAASEKFRETVRDALLKRIGSVSDLDEDDKPKKKRLTDGDEEKPKKKRLTDGDEEKPAKKLADGDEEKPKKKRLTDGDEEKPAKKKRLADGDEEKPKKKLADGDEEKPKKKLADSDEEKPKKKLADGDEEKPKKKLADGDEEKPRKKKVATADDEDRPKVRKRKRDGEGDGEGVREKPAAPLAAVWVDAGLAYGARSLTYAVAADSPKKPPKVLTPAGAGRFEVELYPVALSSRESALAGLGVFGEYGKTFGLSIDVPNTMGKSTPIDQSHYAVGALYRLALGRLAVSAGLGYTRRHYIADRSSLTDPKQLDMPDVDYAAVSPRLGGRAQVAPRVALFTDVEAMLVTSAGAIATTPYYGAGNVFGIGGDGGIDIALGKQIGLRIAAELNQVSLSFKGTGDMASARKVSAATDRDFGATATFAAWY